MKPGALRARGENRNQRFEERSRLNGQSPFSGEWPTNRLCRFVHCGISKRNH